MRRCASPVASLAWSNTCSLSVHPAALFIHPHLAPPAPRLHSAVPPAPQAKALRTPGAETESDDEAAPLLSADDFRHTRQRAVAAVQIPPAVLDLIADLRSYLQEKCEPPVYVSDRRLVKAVALMQVGASGGAVPFSAVSTQGAQHV